MSSDPDTDKMQKDLLLAKKQLDIIRTISTELNKPMGLKAKLESILGTLDIQFGIHHSMILMPDKTRCTLSVFASKGYPETQSLVPFGKGIAGMVAEKKIPINITGLLRKMHYMAIANNTPNTNYIDLPGLAGAQSQIAVPLLSGNELVAVLMAESTASSVFGMEDEKFLLTLTTPIAVSIENAMLFDTMEEKIKDRTAELERINHTKDKLFSIISHDLRSPVASFQGITQLLNHYISRGEPEKIESLSEKIGQSANRLNFLLDNLLNWSLSQGSSIACRYETILLAPFLSEIISIYEENITAKNISVSLSVTSEESVYADHDMLSVIFRNLINNALKFTSRNGTILIEAAKKDTCVNICISDNGVGMNEEQLNSLFTIANKKSTIGTEKERGTGLGLILVYEFVHLNKGKIEVESKINKGTIFKLSLPV